MVLGAGLAGVAKQAEQLRLDGNFYFSKDRYGAAIDAYTEVKFSNFYRNLISFSRYY